MGQAVKKARQKLSKMVFLVRDDDESDDDESEFDESEISCRIRAQHTYLLEISKWISWFDNFWSRKKE